MGLSFRASRVLERLHNAIQIRGQRSLDEFRARLHEQRIHGKREATEMEFIAAAGGDDGVLSGEEAAILFRELGGKDKSIPFAEVLVSYCVLFFTCDLYRLDMNVSLSTVPIVSSAVCTLSSLCLEYDTIP